MQRVEKTPFDELTTEGLCHFFSKIGLSRLYHKIKDSKLDGSKLLVAKCGNAEIEKCLHTETLFQLGVTKEEIEKVKNLMKKGPSELNRDISINIFLEVTVIDRIKNWLKKKIMPFFAGEEVEL